MSRTLVAVDAGTTDVAGAEHVVAVLDDLLPVTLASYVASTHVVHHDGARTLVVASWAGPSTPVAAASVAAALPGSAVVVQVGATETVAGDAGRTGAARQAATQHLDRSAGRLVRFAGRELIEARVSVAAVLAGGVVDEVAALGAGPLPATAHVDLSEWARPTWQAGRVVLHVQQARDGLVPFESRHQIACCSDH